MGTGSAQLLSKMAPHFASSYGVDASEGQIAAAKKAVQELPGVELAVWDCNEFSKYSQMKGHKGYDLIAFAESFHWLDYDNVLAQCASLTPGVVAIIGYTIPRIESKSPLGDKFKEAIYNYEQTLLPYF